MQPNHLNIQDVMLTCDFNNVTSQHRDISKLHKSHVNIIIKHVNIIIFPACRGKEVGHHTMQCFQQNLKMLASPPVAQCRSSEVLIVIIAAIIGEKYKQCIFPILTVNVPQSYLLSQIHIIILLNTFLII